jgi:DNA-binding LytR/AlgR family response regulator
MRLAVKASRGRYRLLEPDEIYYVEAAGHDTRIRTARRRLLPSTLRLAEWEDLLEEAGFVRIHNSYLVNPGRVRELRLRPGDSNDWEVKLDPPVNAVLPVSRTGLRRLRRLYRI